MVYLVTNQAYLFDSEAFKIISLEEGVDLLLPLEELSIDTETEGLDQFTKKLLLLQIGNYDIQVLFDIKSYNGKIPPLLKDFLNTTSKLCLFQNAKFDLKFLLAQEVLIRNVYDTMLVETIITNGLQYDGRDLASIVMKYCKVYLDKSIRGEIIEYGLSNAVLLYGANDIKYLPLVKELQLKKAAELNLEAAINLENAFVVVLAYTEFCGIKLDINKWVKRTAASKLVAHQLKKDLEAQLLKDGKTRYFSGMLDMFTNEPDCLINWDSPKQVLALFKEYGINVMINLKGERKESVDAKVLAPQVNKFSILKPYLTYKEKTTEINTFGENWRRFINPVTNRVHTTFKQINDTGRLSSGSKRDGTPNLQNIPSDHESRECFICEDGNELIDADYSSQEQIVMANFSQEENLLNFYKRGFTDMHSYVAFLMYEDIRRCSLEALTPDKLKYVKEEYPEKRTIAKSAGFAINYGGDGTTIAKNCNIPIADGHFVYKSYFEAFPKLKDYFDLVFQKAAYYGYIQFNNVTKRKFFFDKEKNDFFAFKDLVESPSFWRSTPDAKLIFKEYSSAKSIIQRYSQNYPVQGTAADITKYAGILFFKEILRNNWIGKVLIVNLIHDELLIECPKNLTNTVKQILLDCMVKAGEFFCPIVKLKADALVGDYWVH